MFREGADWPRASRVIDLHPTSSDQDRGQRFGRLVRDHPSKSHISYYSLLPFQTDLSLEEQRLQFSKLFAHFHAILVLENVVRPIRTPRGTAGKREDPATDHLGALPPREQADIIGDCYERLVGLAAEGDVGHQEAGEAIETALEGHGVAPEVVSPMARQVALLMRRRVDPHINCDDLIEHGFDKIWHREILDGVLAFSAGIGGPRTFAEIRAAIAGAYDARWQRIFDRIRRLDAPPRWGDSDYHWCTYAGTLHARGKLDADRVALLESIPWWTWTVGVADRWRDAYDRVAGLAESPPSGTGDYDWVRQQRRMHEQGKLPRGRVQLCEAIPWWSWGGYRDRWHEAHSRIARLPSRPLAPSPEYEWVKYQRKRYEQGKLQADRILLCE